MAGDGNEIAGRQHLHAPVARIYLPLRRRDRHPHIALDRDIERIVGLDQRTGFGADEALARRRETHIVARLVRNDGVELDALAAEADRGDIGDVLGNRIHPPFQRNERGKPDIDRIVLHQRPPGLKFCNVLRMSIEMPTEDVPPRRSEAIEAGLEAVGLLISYMAVKREMNFET